MRYRPEHKESARSSLAAATSRGFKRKGFGGIGVDGLAKEAKVTSGAFYGHFPSKEAAFKEVVTSELEDVRRTITQLRTTVGANWIEAFVDFYLGERRNNELGESCPVQSLSPEVQRASAEVREAFEQKMGEIVQVIADGLPDKSEEIRKDKAWALLSTLSGGVTLARAVNDPAIADGIAIALRKAALAVCQ